VARLGVGLYTDEDVFRALARALRDRGYDAQSCQEAGRAGQGVPDEAQLLYASRHGRAILTFNCTDFLRLDAHWKRAGREHAGIIVSVEVDDLGELIRRVERHLNTYPPSVQHDTLLWLDSSATQ
jgi:Domain of unknown function (DUF5615)